MRPTIAELLKGINRTIMSAGVPKVMMTRDMEAVWELTVANRLLAFIEERWKNEYPRLARENLAMEEILWEAAAALKTSGHPLAADLNEIIGRCHYEITDLPGVETLEQANVELKAGLDIFIAAHEEMGEKSSAELEAVRTRLRNFLKEITARDFEAAQAILYF